MFVRHVTCTIIRAQSGTRVDLETFRLGLASGPLSRDPSVGTDQSEPRQTHAVGPEADPAAGHMTEGTPRKLNALSRVVTSILYIC